MRDFLKVVQKKKLNLITVFLHVALFNSSDTALPSRQMTAHYDHSNK